jgi:ribosomal protein S18 acetylase RimI-like enzyme
MDFSIRSYHPSDLCAVYRICHGTGPGELGMDAELLGHFYAAPYVILEPELCFILTGDGEPCGYILGAKDSAAFSTRCEREWFPVLRARYRLPAEDDQSSKAKLIRRIHAGYRPNPAIAADYPAHLHIDLLPSAQGKKLGQWMMGHFIERLMGFGAAGLHFGTGLSNARALAFYDRLGFQRIIQTPTSVTFGMRPLRPLAGQATHGIRP